MKVVSHYIDPASGIDYVTSIDDYFLFLRYWNMNSFLYFWMAFYTIFFYRFEIKENGLLLNTSYTFMLTFLWQIVLELCSLFLPLKAITTYHDLGDELISQTGMTLLGVATFIHLNHYIKIPVIKSTNARLAGVGLTTGMYLLNGITDDAKRFLMGYNWDVFLHMLMALAVIEYIQKDIGKKVAQQLRNAVCVGWGLGFIFYLDSFWVFVMAIAGMNLAILCGYCWTTDGFNKKMSEIKKFAHSFLPSLTLTLLVTGLVMRFVAPTMSNTPLLWLFGAAVSLLVLEFPTKGTDAAKTSVDAKDWGYFALYVAGVFVFGIYFHMAYPEEFSMNFDATTSNWVITHVGGDIPTRENSKYVGIFAIVGSLLVFGINVIRAFNATDKSKINLLTSIIAAVIATVGTLLMREHHIWMFLFGHMLFVLGFSLHVSHQSKRYLPVTSGGKIEYSPVRF